MLNKYCLYIGQLAYLMLAHKIQKLKSKHQTVGTDAHMYARLTMIAFVQMSRNHMTVRLANGVHPDLGVYNLPQQF